MRIGAGRLALYAVVPMVVAGALLVRHPDFHPRYFFGVLPAFYLLVAHGAASLPRAGRWLATLGLVACAVPPLGHLYADPAFQKQDCRAVIRTVEAAAGPEDTVLMLDGPAFGLIARSRADESPVKIIDLQRTSLRDLDGEALDAAIEVSREGRTSVWLAEDGAASGTGRHYLTARACPVTEESIQDVTLGRYGLWGLQAYEMIDVARPHGAVDLATVPEPDSVPAGGVLPVFLLWFGGDPAASSLYSREHKVSVRLLDADGRIVAQADRRPVNGSRPTTTWRSGEAIRDCHGLLVPAETRPGAHHLEIVLYDEATLEPLFTLRRNDPIRVVAPDANGGARR